ncbi:MAG: hypothetical protein ABWK00_01355 [Desulfurococcaceae archaeon]
MEMGLGLQEALEILEPGRMGPWPHVLVGPLALVAFAAFLATASGVIGGPYAYPGPLGLAGAWLVLMFGFSIAAAFSSYRMVSTISRHLRASALRAYYAFKGGSGEALPSYVAGEAEAGELPSGATSFLLSLLFAPVAYPVLLAISEKVLRAHVAREEGGARPVKEYGASNALVDALLTVASLGAYLSAWSSRIARLYNSHVEFLGTGRAGGGAPPPAELGGGGVAGVAMVALGASCTAAYFGFPGSFVYFSAVAGTVFALYAHRTRALSLGGQIARLLGLAYAVLLSSALIGAFGAPSLYQLYEGFRSSAEAVRGLGVLGLALAIFGNNAMISAAAVAPVLGPAFMGYAISNSGVIYGVATALAPGPRAFAVALLPVMPHAILELLAYAIILSGSSRMSSGIVRAAAIVASGFAVLAAAALVESLSILYGL